MKTARQLLKRLERERPARIQEIISTNEALRDASDAEAKHILRDFRQRQHRSYLAAMSWAMS